MTANSPNASRHMCQIKDEQAMVVRFIARNPDTIAARSSRYVIAIDPDMDLPASDTNQTGILRRTLVHIGNVAMRRIGSLSRSHQRRLDRVGGVRQNLR